MRRLLNRSTPCCLDMPPVDRWNGARDAGSKLQSDIAIDSATLGVDTHGIAGLFCFEASVCGAAWQEGSPALLHADSAGFTRIAVIVRALVPSEAASAPHRELRA